MNEQEFQELHRKLQNPQSSRVIDTGEVNIGMLQADRAQLDEVLRVQCLDFAEKVPGIDYDSVDEYILAADKLFKYVRYNTTSNMS